jgi:hypothetical protein
VVEEISRAFGENVNVIELMTSLDADLMCCAGDETTPARM